MTEQLKFNLIRGDDIAWFPSIWRPYGGGFSLSWLGVTVWVGF